MDKIRNAAIIILGLGEQYAAEILKNMTTKEVEGIMEVITKLDQVSETDVVNALNEFFQEASTTAAIDTIAKEHIKSALLPAMGNNHAAKIMANKATWLDLLKVEPISHIVQIIEHEHPQIITALILMITHQDSEKASEIMKNLPKEMQKDIIKRMTTIRPLSAFAIDKLSQFFEKQIKVPERYQTYKVDGVDALANIISYLDTETENNIMNDLNEVDKNIAEKLQDRIFPFDRLGTLDKRSLQTLVAEVSNDDLAVALKGAAKATVDAIFGSMSAKTAEILKDDMEGKGPAKLAEVLEAQKRIVARAKELASENKISINLKNSSDTVG